MGWVREHSASGTVPAVRRFLLSTACVFALFVAAVPSAHARDAIVKSFDGTPIAGPGEVLVSSTVKDLVVGSGLDFEDRGARELKGVPGEWRLYSVAG